MLVYVKDFGCKVNQVEGEYIRNIILSGGNEILPSYENAQFVILNTCAVTSRAVQKIFQFARRVKACSPAVKLVLVGCLGTFFEKVNQKKQPLFDYIVPQENKLEFVRNIFHPALEFNFWSACDKFVEHTRAFVKIQDGCEHFCSYCVVPFLRGKEVFRPFESIDEQLSKLAEKGFKEVVLVGVRVGSWKGEINGKQENLAGLLRFIINRYPQFRIRLTSIEPWELTEELVELICEFDSMAKHLHIPLQSGSERILQLMRRPYTIREYVNLCERIIRLVPDIAIGTDIIVGFPGETSKDFELTYSLVENLPFAYAHIFRYSARPFTDASRFRGQVRGDVKAERLRRLKLLVQRKRANFVERFINRRLEVIAERKKGELWSSKSSNYIPCFFRSDKELKGMKLSVRGIMRKNNALICELEK